MANRILSVVAVPRRNPNKFAGTKTLSDVFVRVREVLVASATLGGRYDSRQAEREFRRFPERFRPQNGATKDYIRSLTAAV